MKYISIILVALAIISCNSVNREAVGDYRAAGNPDYFLSLKRFGRYTLIMGRDTLEGEWHTGPVGSKSAGTIMFQKGEDILYEGIYDNDTIEFDSLGDRPRVFIKF